LDIFQRELLTKAQKQKGNEQKQKGEEQFSIFCSVFNMENCSMRLADCSTSVLSQQGVTNRFKKTSIGS